MTERRLIATMTIGGVLIVGSEVLLAIAREYWPLWIFLAGFLVFVEPLVEMVVATPPHGDPRRSQ